MNSKFSKIFILVLTVGLVASCAGESDEISSGSSSGSLGDSSPTNIPHASGLFIAYGDNASDVYESDDSLSSTVTQVTVTAYADDMNDLIVSGVAVNFATEWGSFLDGFDSCVLSEGSCSVTWQSGDPLYAPPDCEVAFTAWTVGDETFFDDNDNGYYDSGELFYDTEEPYLDIDSNFQYDATTYSYEGRPEIIDIIDYTGTGDGSNGVHDSVNGLYNGRLCNSNCGTSYTIISKISGMTIQEPFTDTDDLNNNGETDDEVNFCNYSL